MMSASTSPHPSDASIAVTPPPVTFCTVKFCTVGLLHRLVDSLPSIDADACKRLIFARFHTLATHSRIALPLPAPKLAAEVGLHVLGDANSKEMHSSPLTRPRPWTSPR